MSMMAEEDSSPLLHCTICNIALSVHSSVINENSEDSDSCREGVASDCDCRISLEKGRDLNYLCSRRSSKLLSNMSRSMLGGVYKRARRESIPLRGLQDYKHEIGVAASILSENAR